MREILTTPHIGQPAWARRLGTTQCVIYNVRRGLTYKHDWREVQGSKVCLADT